MGRQKCLACMRYVGGTGVKSPLHEQARGGQRGLSLERGGSQGNLIDSLDSVMRRDGSGKHKAQANCIHLR
jgi:hypothetical protein